MNHSLYQDGILKALPVKRLPWLPRSSRDFPIPSCQDLILASPCSNPADVMRLRVEAPLDADAGKYQGQALVGRTFQVQIVGRSDGVGGVRKDARSKGRALAGAFT